MEKVDQVLEALALIQVKQDVLLMVLQQVADRLGLELDVPIYNGYQCPLCRSEVMFRVNALTGGVERVCDCKTGMIPPPQQQIYEMLGLHTKKKERDDGETAELRERIDELEENEEHDRRSSS